LQTSLYGANVIFNDWHSFKSLTMSSGNERDRKWISPNY
jgi:hypothetical protein